MRASRKILPVRPPLPGEVLKETIMDRRGFTQDELASALGVSRVSVNQIIRGRRSITAEMALRLGRVTSTTPEMWLNLQQAVDLHKAGEAVDLTKLKVLRKPGVVIAN